MSIGAGLGAIGGALIGGAASARGARKKYKRDMHMYKNRHQWEVADLKAAGLNPILSAGGSPGTPAAQAAPNQNAGGDAATALQAMKQETELELMGTQVEKNIQDRNIGLTTQNLIEQQRRNAKQQENILKGDAAEAYWKEQIYKSNAGAALTGAKSVSKSLPNFGMGAIFSGKNLSKDLSLQNRTLKKRLSARQRLNQRQKVKMRKPRITRSK